MYNDNNKITFECDSVKEFVHHVAHHYQVSLIENTYFITQLSTDGNQFVLYFCAYHSPRAAPGWPPKLQLRVQIFSPRNLIRRFFAPHTRQRYQCSILL